MSFEPDDTEEQRAIKSQLQQIEKILVGILAGLALMNDLSPAQLIELAEGL